MQQLLKRVHLLTFFITVGSFALFAKLLEDVVTADSITKLDLWVYEHLTLAHTPLATDIFLFITNLLSPINIFLLAIGLLLALMVRRRWEHAYILVFSLLGGVIVEQLLKVIIHRDRPLPLIIAESNFSFPSGHATMATIFLMLLIYAYKDSFKNLWLRWAFIGTSVSLFVLVAISRVYLGVHWVSDVLAGMCLGIFWLTLLINAARVLNHFKKRKLLREVV